MKKYFYTDGTTNFGPFTLEELKAKSITKETYVWFEELGDWKTAGSVPELSNLFKFSSPPPISQTNSNTSTTPRTSEPKKKQQPPRTWLVESILVTLFCCLPFGIAGIVNASKVETLFYDGDFEGANRASAQAKKWMKFGLWGGVIFGVLYLFLMIGIGASGF